MSSSVCRRLHSLFATAQTTTRTASLVKNTKPTTTTSLQKNPKPTTTTSATTQTTTKSASLVKNTKPTTTTSLQKNPKPTTTTSATTQTTTKSASLVKNNKPTTTTTSLPKNPKPTTTTSATTASYDDESHETLLALVAKFKKSSGSNRFRLNYKAYLKTVTLLALSNKHSLIDEILQHQKQYPDITNERFAIRLISLYGKSGMFDHARKLFDELPHLKCKRTVMSFNALLSACVHSRRFGLISNLLNELPRELSIRPDTVSYNIVIKAFCHMGSFDSALALVNEMEESGMEPDLITFNTLFDAFYKNGMFEEAEMAWGLMRENNIVPTGRTCSSKIRALVIGKRIPEAVEVLQEMRSKGVKLNVFVFDAVIKGFCDDGNLEEAKNWYKEMGKAGFYSPVALRSLGNGACKEGEFEFALELCKEAIRQLCNPGTTLMQRVVDGLVEVSKVEEAKELVELGKSNSYHQYKLEIPSEFR